MKFALKIVAINVAVLLALCLAGEIVFGNWFFGPDYRGMNIPRDLARTFDVNALYRRDAPIRYTRDEFGFRGPYAGLDVIDVLTLGGSTTNQLYVDDDETWQAEMRRGFAAIGKPKSIVNAAVDGQSSYGHIAVFDRWFPNVPGLKARFVLAYVGVNDVALDAPTKFDDMHSPDPMRRFADMIRNKSALYDLFRTVRGMVRARRANLVHSESWEPPTAWGNWAPVGVEAGAPSGVPPDGEGSLADYADRLRELARRVRAFGAEPIFVTQPAGTFRIRDGRIWVPLDGEGGLIPDGYRWIAPLNETTMRVCRDLGAICVDLASRLSFADGDFYDPVHNTPSGTRKIGRFLFEALRDRI